MWEHNHYQPTGKLELPLNAQATATEVVIFLFVHR